MLLFLFITLLPGLSNDEGLLQSCFKLVRWLWGPGTCVRAPGGAGRFVILGFRKEANRGKRHQNKAISLLYIQPDICQIQCMLCYSLVSTGQSGVHKESEELEFSLSQSNSLEMMTALKCMITARIYQTCLCTAPPGELLQELSNGTWTGGCQHTHLVTCCCFAGHSTPSPWPKGRGFLPKTGMLAASCHSDRQDLSSPPVAISEELLPPLCSCQGCWKTPAGNPALITLVTSETPPHTSPQLPRSFRHKNVLLCEDMHNYSQGRHAHASGQDFCPTAPSFCSWRGLGAVALPRALAHPGESPHEDPPCRGDAAAMAQEQGGHLEGHLCVQGGVKEPHALVLVQKPGPHSGGQRTSVLCAPGSATC